VRMGKSSWYRNPQLWVEVFALANLSFLVPDIYLAHSVNMFRHAAEYVPLAFSLVAPLVLVVGLAALYWWKSTRWWRWLGLAVGWTAVAVGVAGLLLHLESRFFYENTLESLVYTAPFAAPLAYTGIGLLLILNRMVRVDLADWPRWVLLLALGGFVGNFIFSLADHAQNGFFYPTEWIAVAASALAVGFLLVPFLIAVDRSYILWCAGVMLIETVVGFVGFYYHTTANIHGPSPHTFDNFVYGAPALAPLLFPNLAVLSFIALVSWWPRLPARVHAPPVGE
jgi:hypothetical protein